MTCDETWIFQYDFETKWQLGNFRFTDTPCCNTLTDK